MRKATKLALLAAVMVSAAAGGYYLRQSTSENSALREEKTDLGVQVSPRLPPFELPDLSGVLRRAEEWHGQLLIINFWATWCPPCREEIPMFIELQRRYRDRGLQFVGIAIDDPASVVAYVEAVGVNYPILIGDLIGIELSKTMGNQSGGLPFTAVVDRRGKIVLANVGVLTVEDAEAVLSAHL